MMPIFTSLGERGLFIFAMSGIITRWSRSTTSGIHLLRGRRLLARRRLRGRLGLPAIGLTRRLHRAPRGERRDHEHLEQSHVGLLQFGRVMARAQISSRIRSPSTVSAMPMCRSLPRSIGLRRSRQCLCARSASHVPIRARRLPRAENAENAGARRTPSEAFGESRANLEATIYMVRTRTAEVTRR